MSVAGSISSQTVSSLTVISKTKNSVTIIWNRPAGAEVDRYFVNISGSGVNRCDQTENAHHSFQGLAAYTTYRVGVTLRGPLERLNTGSGTSTYRYPISTTTERIFATSPDGMYASLLCYLTVLKRNIIIYFILL